MRAHDILCGSAGKTHSDSRLPADQLFSSSQADSSAQEDFFEDQGQFEEKLSRSQAAGSIYKTFWTFFPAEASSLFPSKVTPFVADYSGCLPLKVKPNRPISLFSRKLSFKIVLLRTAHFSFTFFIPRIVLTTYGRLGIYPLRFHKKHPVCACYHTASSAKSFFVVSLIFC